MKIVINSCFGGFSLSPEALLELIKRDAKCVEKIPIEDYYGKNIKDYPWKERMKEGNEKFKPFTEGYEVHTWYTALKKDGIIYSYDRDKDRDDPDLVEVVELLKNKADGQCADLKIVEIPDGVDWQIDEYDGLESVHEKHRSWD